LLPKEARARTGGEPTDLHEIKNQDFFNQTQKKIRNNGHSIDLQLLTRRFGNFDASQTGQIAAHKLVGVLKHNYSFIFDEDTLRGLQFELESLYNDHKVDYRDFVETFFRDSDADKNARKAGVTRINLGENKSGRTAYNA
jgi:Ca2+-binding EF-hand superfamily protein